MKILKASCHSWSSAQYLSNEFSWIGFARRFVYPLALRYMPACYTVCTRNSEKCEAAATTSFTFEIHVCMSICTMHKESDKPSRHEKNNNNNIHTHSRETEVACSQMLSIAKHLFRIKCTSGWLAGWLVGLFVVRFFFAALIFIFHLTLPVCSFLAQLLRFDCVLKKCLFSVFLLYSYVYGLVLVVVGWISSIQFNAVATADTHRIAAS